MSAKASPTPQMLFYAINGHPAATLPWELVRGPVRRPDGVELLSVAQAAERFGLSADVLAKIWRTTLGECCEPDELELIMEGGLRAACGEGGAGAK